MTPGRDIRILRYGGKIVNGDRLMSTGAAGAINMAANPQTVEQPSPTYAVAELFPPEGQWTEEEYLALDANRI
ncbi:MAG: hypothetical protein HY023_11515, partial [Chloroflexi bacterium]|nr:hypothetical protein [Chloroflexota bacterium]